MEKAPNTTPLNPEKVTIQHPEVDPAIIEWLEEAYGKKERWKTDHLNHFHYYLILMEIELEAKVSNKFTLRKSQAESLILDAKKEADRLNNHIEEIYNSDLSSDMKKAISAELHGLSMRTLEQAYQQAEQVLTESNKGQGRPTKPLAFQAWLDYLNRELGSWNKAYDYAANHPIFDNLGSAESIRRFNNKFRQGGK